MMSFLPSIFNPKYSSLELRKRRSKDLYQALVTLFILAVIPLTVALTFQRQIMQKKAAEEERVSLEVPKVECPRVKLEIFEEKPDPERGQRVVELGKGANKDLSQTFGTYKNAHYIEKLGLQEELKEKASVRKNYLVEAMYQNPEATFSLLLDPSEREALKEVTANCVESLETLEGRLEVLVADYFEESVSRTIYILNVSDKQRLTLHPAGGLKFTLQSGSKVKVRGFLLDNNLFFDGTKSISQADSGIDILESQSAVPVIGEQRVIVILGNFRNTRQPDLPREEVEAMVFNEVNSYYVEVSFNKVSLSGEVKDWYQMAIDQMCEMVAVTDAAVAAADPEVYFPDYSRLIIISPFNCRWAGLGTIGKRNLSTADGQVSMSVSWISVMYGASPGVIGHELGHNFGNLHANFLNCGEVPIRESGCPSEEYGDLYDIMGRAGSKGHFSASHKENVGWFEASNIQVVSQSGTYTVEPIETATSGVKALKIPRREAGNYLYMEYRQPIGFDRRFQDYFGGAVYKGALFHLTPGPNSFSPIFLIDTTPPTEAYTPVLEPGRTLQDPETNTTITTISKTETSITVEVNLKTRNPPQVTITSPVNGDVVSGNVTVAATATDDRGVGRVEFYYIENEGNLFATDTDEPYSGIWNSTLVPNGLRWLYAVAHDLDGLYGVSPYVKVTVENVTSPPQTPVATPPGGTYSSNQSVALSSVNADSIRYTLDGSEPDENSSFYSAPILITAPTTLKAKGFNAFGSSEVMTENYIIQPPTVSHWVSFGPKGTPSSNWDTAREVLDLLVTTGKDPLGISHYRSDLGNWEGYIKTPSGYVGKNFDIPLKEGYMIEFRGDPGPIESLFGDYSYVGQQTYNTVSGFNLISIPDIITIGPPSGPLTAEGLCQLINNQGGFVVEILNHTRSEDIKEANWTTHRCGTAENDFGISVGQAYFIKATADSSWFFPEPLREPADKTPPEVSVTSPKHAETISGQVSLKVSASDNVAVTKVEFQVNTQIRGEDTTPPYEFIWDTQKEKNTLHNLWAIAYDQAGNSQKSTLVGVNVDNQLLRAKNKVVVRVKGDPYWKVGNRGFFWPKMQLRVDGKYLKAGEKTKTIEINHFEYKEHEFVMEGVSESSKVDIAFINDRWNRRTKQDINLYVDWVEIGGRKIQSEDKSVRYDGGSSLRAFDGKDVIKGQESMWWNGALRFNQSEIPVK